MKKQAEISVKSNLEKFRDDEMPHILEPGEVGAILEVEVKDKDGNVTAQKRMKSESFVRQFLELLYIQMDQRSEDHPYQARDTENNVQDLHYSAVTMRCTAGVGDTTYGIRVGTGDTPPNIDDYALEDACGEGTGADEFEHGAVSFGAPASDGTVAQFTITRNFANDSGAGINVEEVGLYSRAFHFNVIYSVMTIRDVIAGGILVPPGQTLTVNYRVQVML